MNMIIGHPIRDEEVEAYKEALNKEIPFRMRYPSGRMRKIGYCRVIEVIQSSRDCTPRNMVRIELLGQEVAKKYNELTMTQMDVSISGHSEES